MITCTELYDLPGSIIGGNNFSMIYVDNTILIADSERLVYESMNKGLSTNFKKNIAQGVSYVHQNQPFTEI